MVAGASKLAAIRCRDAWRRSSAPVKGVRTSRASCFEQVVDDAPG